MRIGALIGGWWLRELASWQVFLKRHALAEATYRRALALNENDDVARGFIANLLALRGANEEALRELQLLASVRPKQASIPFNMGFIQESLGQFSEAESSFRKALELDPKLDRAWYGLGLVLISQGRPTEALGALKRNTELQPMSPYGWYQLAMTHHHLGDAAEARRIKKHLEGFEPNIAAQLKRDLEQVPPQFESLRAQQG